jgi:hypothetical protein
VICFFVSIFLSVRKRACRTLAGFLLHNAAMLEILPTNNHTGACSAKWRAHDRNAPYISASSRSPLVGGRSHALSDLTANTLPKSCLRYARRGHQHSGLLQASKMVPETLLTNIYVATFETLFASSAQWTSPPTTRCSTLSSCQTLHTIPHRPSPLFRLISANSCRTSLGKICRPTHASLHELQSRPPPHQHNPCRGSSIGRACGSYNSKEINLKVVGSSPTFGYSYIKAH